MRDFERAEAAKSAAFAVWQAHFLDQAAPLAGMLANEASVPLDPFASETHKPCWCSCATAHPSEDVCDMEAVVTRPAASAAIGTVDLHVCAPCFSSPVTAAFPSPVTATTDSTDENLAAQPQPARRLDQRQGHVPDPGRRADVPQRVPPRVPPGTPAGIRLQPQARGHPARPDGSPASSASSPNLVAQMLAVPIGSGEGSLASVIPHSAPPGCWPGNG